MVIENDPSARMQVRTLGELKHPATCMVCGNGNYDEGYVDLGVFYDFEGSQYLCGLCVTQAGETYGMFTPSEVKSQLELIEKLIAENAAYEEELNNVRPLVAAVSKLSSLNSLNSDYVDGGPVSEEPKPLPDFVSTGSGTRNDPLKLSITGSEDGEPDSEEPVKGSGRSNSSRAKPRDITF